MIDDCDQEVKQILKEFALIENRDFLEILASNDTLI